MWQKLSVKSFQQTQSVSLPVHCHSSPNRYFKFDFENTLRSTAARVWFLLPAVRSPQKLKICSLAVCLTRRSWDEVKCHCWQTRILMSVTQPVYIPCLCMWQVHSRYLYDRADSSPSTMLTAGWECGTTERHWDKWSVAYAPLRVTKHKSVTAEQSCQ